MFVHTYYLEQTGTIIQENTQQLVSGLVSYATPFTLETGTRFSVIDRGTYYDKSDESHRAEHDKLVVQFGATEIRKLNSSGIYLKEGDTRLQYDGQEFRAKSINNFGQPINRSYLPGGIVQIVFLRRKPVAH